MIGNDSGWLHSMLSAVLTRWLWFKNKGLPTRLEVAVMKIDGGATGWRSEISSRDVFLISENRSHAGHWLVAFP